MNQVIVTLIAALPQSAGSEVERLRHELYRTQIAAAESAVRLGELSIARSWLDATDPALRGFEWKVHDSSLDESLASFALGETGPTALALSRDGATLAAGLANGKLELRASTDGRVLATLDAHAEAVTYARFDANGERLVTSSYDRVVKVWDVAARQAVVEFRGHGFAVGGACFSPDGTLVASGAYERPSNAVVGTVRVWNSTDGSVVRTLEGGRKPLVGLEFSPDGKRIAAGSWDFCVFVWNVEGGAPVKCAMPDEGIYNAVDGVAWSPDGKFVAGASKDRTARVWNPNTGELVATLRGHTDYVAKLVFSADGATLVTASNDGTLRLWNTSDWSARSTLRGHRDDVVDVCFARDGSRIFSASEDLTVRAWDARVTQYGGAVARTSAAPYVARFSPDDSRIASASYDGRIQLWNARTLEPEAAWQAHPPDKSCHALAWTSDGAQLFSGSWEPVVRLWDVATRTELAAFEQSAGTYYLATSPVGPLAATCAGNVVIVYDLAARKKLHEFSGHAKPVLAASFSPDGARVVTAGRDGKAFVFDARAGTRSFTIAGSGAEVAEAVFTPDGRAIVVAGREGTVALHSATDGSRIRELASLRHGIEHLDVSPDGTRVAAASDTVVLIDLVRGGDVGRLRPHAEHPYNLDFDSRGLRLASCATDRTLVVSDTRPLRDRLADLPGR